jgi:hypothetical protein
MTRKTRRVRTLKGLTKKETRAVRKAVKFQGGRCRQTAKGLEILFLEDRNPYSRPWHKWQNALLDLGWV